MVTTTSDGCSARTSSRERPNSRSSPAPWLSMTTSTAASSSASAARPASSDPSATDRFGALERSQVRGGELAEVVELHLATGTGNDDRAHPLTERRFGQSHHRDVGDVGVLEQHGLDLGAVHVLAAADDHVLDAVDHV